MNIPISKTTPAPDVTNRVIGTTAVVAATGALACGICCVLPFALPAAVVALTGGAMAWWGSMMPLVRDFAAVAVALGWLWVGQQSYRTNRRPAVSTVVVMVFATAMLAGALAWPHFEGQIMGWVRDR